MYTFLLALIYLAFISLGLPDSLLGSAWPAMHVDLDLPISYMGIISMVISGGTIISSLLSSRLTRRFGTRIVTVISVFLTAAAMMGFSVSDSLLMLIAFAVPYGLGAGAIDAALNNYVALHYTSRHMSWLHCFWGVGTVISPFVMSRALATSGWNTGYRIVGTAQFIIGLILLATLPVWKVNANSGEGKGQKSLSLSKALKIKGVPFLLLGFFAYCAAEATSMNWASTYLAEYRGVDAKVAASFGSLFFIGITAGRFLSGFIMNRLGDRRMIILGTSVLVCGIILLVIPAGTILPIIGFIIIGLGCAPIYPCIIHSTPSNFGAENSGAIIGIQMASAYVGSTFMPPLFGVLGKNMTFGIMPFYLLVFVLLMISMTELTFRVTRKETAVEAGPDV